MKNRPLLCVCLLLLFAISIVTIGGGEKFIKELRPSPIEQYAEAEENITVQGTIYRQEQKETYQKIYLNHNSIIKFQKTNHKIQIKENKILIYLKSNQKLHIGNKVKITGEVSFFDKARNPGNFDQKFYYQKQDIHACVWAENAEVIDTKTDTLKDCLAEFRMQWRALLEDELGERGGTILAAVLLGEKDGMDPEVKELYQANGIGHILAISGLHLSFIGIGVYRMLRRGTGAYWLGGITGGIFLLLYVMMIGMTVSVIRAWVMFLFRIGADITGRHYDMPTALAAAAVITVYGNPLYIFDGSFWLSFGAVLAVCVTMPVIRKLPGKTFLASVGINSVLWPVILYCFYEIPVYSVILNLIVIPCMSVLLSLGMAGSVLCSLDIGIGNILMQICKWILILYETGCRYTLNIPKARWIIGRPEMARIVIYYVLLGVVLGVLYKNLDAGPKMQKRRIKRRRMIIAAAIYLCGFFILVSGHSQRKGIEITMLDVGQGDCICVEAPDGSNYLIDGGSSDVKNVGKYRIEPFLKARGIEALDYIFVSHGDLDHMSGIEELLERQKIGVEVKNIVFPSKEYWDENLKKLADKAKKYGADIWILEYGKKIQNEKLVFRCLGPERTTKVQKGNAASMILHLSYEGFDMLFTGDVEKDGEEHLTEKIGKDQELKNISWEILKVAHHGSKNSTSEEFLKDSEPKYAWISAGRKNRYGHPHKETLKRLGKYQIPIFTTQETGAIGVSIREKTMVIHQRNG